MINREFLQLCQSAFSQSSEGSSVPSPDLSPSLLPFYFLLQIALEESDDYVEFVAFQKLAWPTMSEEEREWDEERRKVEDAGKTINDPGVPEMLATRWKNASNAKDLSSTSHTSQSPQFLSFSVLRFFCVLFQK